MCDESLVLKVWNLLHRIPLQHFSGKNWLSWFTIDFVQCFDLTYLKITCISYVWKYKNNFYSLIFLYNSSATRKCHVHNFGYNFKTFIGWGQQIVITKITFNPRPTSRLISVNIYNLTFWIALTGGMWNQVKLMSNEPN